MLHIIGLELYKVICNIDSDHFGNMVVLVSERYSKAAQGAAQSSWCVAEV